MKVALILTQNLSELGVVSDSLSFEYLMSPLSFSLLDISTTCLGCALEGYWHPFT